MKPLPSSEVKVSRVIIHLLTIYKEFVLKAIVLLYESETLSWSPLLIIMLCLDEETKEKKMMELEKCSWKIRVAYPLVETQYGEV